MPEQKQPGKICRVGGREFWIFREYDDLVENDVFIYPDFEEYPEFTDEGRPFVTAAQECCRHSKSADTEDSSPGGCGGCGDCVWFRRDETPYDMIGVCMNDELL